MDVARLGLLSRSLYFSAKLVYLRVAAIGAHDLVPHDTSRPMNASVKLQLAGQVLRTRLGVPPGTPNPMWNKEFMFVSGLQVSRSAAQQILNEKILKRVGP
ncbi:hypothetical protein ZWY2020_011384 [Hordeum vulgare]|nr:hypothetical protein ZWY2020_011384 [Hordeum vulgare]